MAVRGDTIVRNVIWFVVGLTAFQSMACSAGDGDSAACGPECATVSSPARSPSGDWVLSIREDTDSARFWKVGVSSTATGEVVIEDPAKYYRQHTTYVLWGKDDVAWIYSGDIGVFLLKRVDGQWVRETLRRGDATISEAPTRLKQLRPRTFPSRQ